MKKIIIILCWLATENSLLAADHQTNHHTLNKPKEKLVYAAKTDFKSFANLKGMQVYYGLLHAHTGLSDGKGSPTEAFQMAKNNGLDFFAVTDHLEKLWFFKKRWKTLKTMAQEETKDGQFVALHGFEWGGTPSFKGWYNHMNFIGTDEVFSPLKGLKKVYKKISKMTGQFIGQFNHPGMIKFKAPLSQNQWMDFKYYPEADQKIQLMRVGTGLSHGERHHETVGYIPALDKGWHLSPQSSEDNHRRDWGSGTRRTGVWAENLTKTSLIKAIQEMATFYTDDSNASVKLVADGKWMMGSTLKKSGSVQLDVDINDPDVEDSVITVELITYQGKVLKRTRGGNHPYHVSFTVNPLDDTYYFVRVLQPDGDRLISAPIFIDRE